MRLLGFEINKNEEVNRCNMETSISGFLIKAGVVGALVYGALNGTTVHASSGITEGLQPLIDILKDLAEPVAYGFMIKGFMQIMSGEEQQGMKVIKGAITGYIGIQWIPYIFRIIRGIYF